MCRQEKLLGGHLLLLYCHIHHRAAFSIPDGIRTVDDERLGL